MSFLQQANTTVDTANAVAALAVVLLTLAPRQALVQSCARLVVIAAVALQFREPLVFEAPTTVLLHLAALGLLAWSFVSFCRADEHSGADSPPPRLARAAQALALAAPAAAVMNVAALAVPAAASIGDALLLAAMVGAFAAGYGLLWGRLSAAGSRRARLHAAILLLGSLLAFGPVLLLDVVPVLLGRQAQLPVAIASALLLGLLVAVAVVALRRRVGSLVAVVHRLSVYALLGLALVLAYVALAYGLERAAGSPGDALSQLSILGFAAIAAITYGPLRTRLHRLVDALLYRDHYEYGATLRRFSQEFAALHTGDDVVAMLLEGVLTTLNLAGTAFVAIPERIDERVLSLIEEADLTVRGWVGDAGACGRIVSGLATLDLTRHEFSPERPLLLDPWPGCAALVLVGAGESAEGNALLILGPKRSGATLRGADGALLATIAPQAATALSNAFLLEGLKTSLAQVQLSTAQLVSARAEQQLLLRQLVDAEERQRAALAHDLHDDALQEVLYLVRHSRLAHELARAGDSMHVPGVRATGDNRHERDSDLPAAASGRLHQELTLLAERAVIAEQRLRALCLGLYPALLPSLGLLAAIEELAHELSISSDVEVDVTHSPEAAKALAALDDETTLHLYRIAQEALRNATRHSHASAAAVSLTCDEDGGASVGEARPSSARTPRCVRLEVADNGVGISLPLDYPALLRDGHLGLAGMRQRAERVGADMRVQRPHGGGTAVVIELPIEPSQFRKGKR